MLSKTFQRVCDTKNVIKKYKKEAIVKESKESAEVLKVTTEGVLNPKLAVVPTAASREEWLFPKSMLSLQKRRVCPAALTCLSFMLLYGKT